MPFDYNQAKDALSEAEKARILCVFLNMGHSTVMQSCDWKAATAQFGSKSVEAMKKGVTNTYKKLTKTGDVGEDIPAKSPVSKKRKATAESAGGDENAGIPIKRTPRKNQKADVKTEVSDEEV